MDKENVLKLIEENPALIDIDTDYNRIIEGFVNRFKQVFTLSAYNVNLPSPIESELFSLIFSGPCVTSKYGHEVYYNIPDMISFFFALASNIKDNDKKEEAVKNVWELIKIILPFCLNTNSLYDALIRAINIYKPDVIDNNVMLNVLGNTVNKEMYVNTDVFTEYVHLNSIGQLLNRSLSSDYKTAIVYSEIIKGLRSDKLTGLSAEEIVTFFTTQNSDIIIKNFDVNTLVMNIYADLYKMGNLDDYVKLQTKNLELNYQFAGIECKDTHESTFDKLSSHYLNLKTIFDRLITLKYNDGKSVLYDKVVAYILIHVPPASFLVYSSYKILYDDVVSHYNILNNTYGYNIIKKIIKMAPNINIPFELMNILFYEEDYDDIIEGLKTGFVRYALHVTERLGLGFASYDDKGKNIDPYFYLSFLEKIDYIINTVDCLPSDIKDDDEEAENKKYLLTLRDTPVYQELDLKGTLERTNEYIRDLKESLILASSMPSTVKK